MQRVKKGIDAFEMVDPRRFAEVFDSGELRGAFVAVVPSVVTDAGSPRRAVERIEVIGDVRRDFAEHVQVACKDGYAEPQCFDKRHPVTLDERRKEKGARMLQPGVKAFVGAVGLFDHRARQACATFQHVDDVLAFPASTPDHDQLRRGVPELFDQTPPDMQDEPVILRGSMVPSITK